MGSLLDRCSCTPATTSGLEQRTHTACKAINSLHLARTTRQGNDPFACEVREDTGKGGGGGGPHCIGIAVGTCSISREYVIGPRRPFDTTGHRPSFAP